MLANKQFGESGMGLSIYLSLSLSLSLSLGARITYTKAY